MGSQNTSLRKFPVEIRLMIFELCLSIIPATTPYHESIAQVTPPLLVALRGEKDLYGEAICTFYKINTCYLTFKNYEDFSLRDYNSDCIKNLRHLGIHYPSVGGYRKGVRPGFYPTYSKTSLGRVNCRLCFFVKNVPERMAANLITVHVDLEEEVDGIFEASTCLPLFVRHLTALQSFTLNKVISGRGKWSESRHRSRGHRDWFVNYYYYRPGTVNPFILRMNHLFGVKGRQEFDVLPSRTIQRSTARGLVDTLVHCVIQRWAWKAKKGEILKQSNYFNKLCREAHDGPCKRKLLGKDEDTSRGMA
ncbi:hypothetical protein HYFRA_00012028 [Hymenoscyphus fraxineus]|uniref:Uncharacterized protein n=1 Tax=Hymenoscyphus fraxineus TaxID=746836 RepID=A0A9N9PWU6_9HELO|nr:hypothetical protein HYFRA_00012028 [Hymenoscyphus fraxineus]